MQDKNHGNGNNKGLLFSNPLGLPEQTLAQRQLLKLNQLQALSMKLLTRCVSLAKATPVASNDPEFDVLAITQALNEIFKLVPRVSGEAKFYMAVDTMANDLLAAIEKGDANGTVVAATNLDAIIVEAAKEYAPVAKEYAPVAKATNTKKNKPKN